MSQGEGITSSAEQLCRKSWETEDDLHVCRRHRHDLGWHVCMCTASHLEVIEKDLAPPAEA